jgi:hypothetical protein
MRVFDLWGGKLDYWVAMALGKPQAWVDHIDVCWYLPTPFDERQSFCPSASWSEGGPIIHRAGMSVMREYVGVTTWGWEATVDDINLGLPERWACGPSPLIAAMRAIVLSKFGEEVSDEIPNSPPAKG